MNGQGRGRRRYSRWQGHHDLLEREPGSGKQIEAEVFEVDVGTGCFFYFAAQLVSHRFAISHFRRHNGGCEHQE